MTPDACWANLRTAHQRSRPQTWRTLEAPRAVAHAIGEARSSARVVLVDCMTLLVSNVILALGDEPDAAAAQHEAPDAKPGDDAKPDQPWRPRRGTRRLTLRRTGEPPVRCRQRSPRPVM